MEFLRYLYDIISFVVLSMRSISMYEHIENGLPEKIKRVKS